MLATMLSLAVSGLGAQAYPTKPIKLIVGFGSGGIVAADVAKAAPDGYTIFLMSNGNAVSESLYKSLPFDLQKDFAMVTTLGFFDLAVVVKGDSPHATMKDLLTWLRANPGKENIGTINVGSTQNLAVELLLSLGNIDAEVIPYKGSSDVLVALRGNDVQVGVDMLAPLVNQAKSGAVKIPATTGEQRYAGTPNIPTVAESGIPGCSASSWNAIAVPVKTPRPSSTSSTRNSTPPSPRPR